jgi:hypothetical protein
MDSDERTFRTSEIREQRRRLERRVALQQRQLEALAKLDEAAAELEQVERDLQQAERDMEAPPREDAQPRQPAEVVHPDAQPRQPAEVVHPDAEPSATGERSAKILKDQAGTWLAPRAIMAEMEKRGWVDGPSDLVIGRLRHSLRRLADNHPSIERDESNTTYRYRWRPDAEDDRALALVPDANGAAYPVPSGGDQMTG